MAGVAVVVVGVEGCNGWYILVGGGVLCSPSTSSQSTIPCGGGWCTITSCSPLCTPGVDGGGGGGWGANGGDNKGSSASEPQFSPRSGYFPFFFVVLSSPLLFLAGDLDTPLLRVPDP